MKHFFLKIAIILLVVIITGCGVTRIVSGTDNKRDSVRVEYKTEYIERIDTAYVEIPKIVEKIIARDTTSLIENEYAISRASILTGGHLYHTLETKPVKRPIAVKSVEVVRDSIVWRDHDVYVEKPVEVVKPMSRFVKYQIAGFWILLLIVGVRLYIKFKSRWW